jgi:hypothetical protein
MSDLISDDLLARHGITGLTPEKNRAILAAVVIAVRNRLTAKLLGQLTSQELAELESSPEYTLEDKLSNLAQTYGMKDWVQSEAEAVASDIASKSRKI